MSNLATIFVAAKRNGGLLLNIGGQGFPRNVSVTDFIKLCSNRQSTKREHNNN
jgi:hypothetical protein